ncbi:MAG: hypothetical protein AAFW60_05155, partial [Pseudomonadota bacterium]
MSFLCLIAQFIPGIVLLELLVSLLPHSLFIGVLASLALASVRPRIALLGAGLVLGSAMPFLLFSKYQTPTEVECAPNECLTVITANIHGRRDAMEQLSVLAIR